MKPKIEFEPSQQPTLEKDVIRQLQDDIKEAEEMLKDKSLSSEDRQIYFDLIKENEDKIWREKMKNEPVLPIRLSREDREALERYRVGTEKLRELMIEANQHQQTLLQFLIDHKARIPDVSNKQTSESFKKEVAITFAQAMESYEMEKAGMRYTGMIHSKRLEDDEKFYAEFKKTFEECHKWALEHGRYSEQVEAEIKEKFSTEEYLENPELKDFIALIRTFQIKFFEPPYEGTTSFRDPITRERTFGVDVYGGRELSVRYDADYIQERHGKEAEQWLIPNLPDKVVIQNIPFGLGVRGKDTLKLGDSFEKILEKVKEYGQLLEQKPKEAFLMLDATGTSTSDTVQEALKKLNRSRLSRLHEARNKQISPSYSIFMNR